MPIYLKTEYDGNKRLYFYQYGTVGTHYYFDINSAVSQSNAYQRAVRQANAIHASQSKSMNKKQLKSKKK